MENPKPEDIHYTTKGDEEAMKNVPLLKKTVVKDGKIYEMQYKYFEGAMHVISFKQV